MKTENLEIERKFLLKNVPKFDRSEVNKFLIHQIYIVIANKNTRFRMTEKFDTKDSGPEVERTYIQCRKKRLSPGVFEEIEHEITEEMFREYCGHPHSYIIKTRYVYEHGGFNWEVDEYHDIKMVTMEVELDDINQEITIPEIIEKEVIVEVTGQKVFSNYSLSIKEGALS